MKTIKIATTGRRKIEGTLFIPKRSRTARPGALFLHGWGGDRQRQLLPAKLLSDLGFVSLAVDLRGHGKTRRLGQSVSAYDNLKDALAAYDFLASRKNVNKDLMLVAGYSYGGFLAVLVSAERNVRWLALRSPALYRDKDMFIPKAAIKRRGLMAFRRRQLSPSDALGLRASTGIRAHVLVIEADRDRVIPRQQVRNYLRALRQAESVKHRIIHEADHAMSREEWYLAAVETFMQWLRDKEATRKPASKARTALARRIASPT
jgi:uncharacterized protein